MPRKVRQKVANSCSCLAAPLTRNRFKEHFFLALEIPLPPLAEQRRIVALIEELAAKIAEARSLRQQDAEEAKTLLGRVAETAFTNDMHQNAWTKSAVSSPTARTRPRDT